MDDSEDTDAEGAESSSVRRFPAWIRASVVAVMLLLVLAVVSGMFLY